MLTELCPGKRSLTSQGTYGLCIRCDRLHPAGEMEPGVQQVSGVAECADWQPLRMVQRNRMCERVSL